MSGRELVILLLGLAIVAVVLRGLYVAINARRGQIKLAIDKNIPQNVDLEALEMAELPGGGARVVTRSLEEVNRQNSALDVAESKAAKIGLADVEREDHIPVLMDAVELNEPEEAVGEEYVAEQEAQIQTPDIDSEPESFDQVDAVEREEEFDEQEEDFNPHVEQTHSLGEDWEEDEAEYDEGPEAAPETLQQDENEEHEDDPDDVLFDYEEDAQPVEHRQADTLSSVAPDYEDDEPAVDEEQEQAYSDSSDDDSYDDELESYEDDSEEYPEDDSVTTTGELEEDEEQSTAFDADSSADEFSMTAGERIGGNPPRIEEVDQSNLFDEEEQSEESNKQPKKSLFSMFGRKSKSAEQIDEAEVQEAEDDVFEQTQEILSEQVDLVDAFEEEDGEEFVAEEVEQAEPIEPLVDELDQKRAAAHEVEAEAGQDEFEHSEVLVLNVTAKDGRVFNGDDLLHILILSGLKFGEMNIFHKRISKDNQGAVIFSVANMLNPGTFDLNNMDEFTTLGISFFLALPTAINNLDAFEQMLNVAQDIRDTLDGDLKDDHRNGMTAQTIEHYRQRIRDFELRRLKAVAARG